MKKIRRAFLLALSLGFAAISGGVIPSGAQVSGAVRPILVGSIQGTINPATDDYLLATIRRAERENAQAVIMTLDTPGGLLTSTHTMAQAINQSKVPVIFYTTPAAASATSAGALLMLASHVAAMTPGSRMGAAHPVSSGGNDIGADMKEKAVNDTVAFAQSMAGLRGRNQELAALIVSKSQSFTANEAKAKGLVEIIADSEADLLRQLDGRKVALRTGGFDIGAATGAVKDTAKDTAKGTAPDRLKTAASEEATGTVTLQTKDAPVVRVDMTLGQKLLNILANPNIAAILATLAMLLIYVELQAPGIQIAGALGVIFFIVSFISFQTLPIRIGAIALMALGLALMIAEVFATAHGALAIGGVISFILGLVWVADPSQISRGVSPAVWIPAALALGIGALAIGFAASRIQRQSLLARASIKGGGVAGLEGYEARVESLAGNALMSPFGRVQIRGELWNFVSDEPVRAGDLVSVEKVDGLKLKVRKV